MSFDTEEQLNQVLVQLQELQKAMAADHQPDDSWQILLVFALCLVVVLLVCGFTLCVVPRFRSMVSRMVGCSTPPMMPLLAAPNDAINEDGLEDVEP